MTNPDLPTLVTGLATMSLGTALLLDQIGEWDLTFAGLAPMFLAAIGVILLATGMAKRDLDR